jgi:DNA repair exonuclease SbcCD nuclease subunit
MIRLLCTGDLHLGRNPSRIPGERVLDQTSFTTAAAWNRIVDIAIEEHVDALLISGDLIDLHNRLYEAFGPIEAGLRRLSAADIPVIAVAGNHDFSTAPTLADHFPGAFVLLGSNQAWQRYTLVDGNGEPRLHIDGWSFRREHVTENPLDTYTLTRDSGVPLVGLLHTDLDVTGSRYAPVRKAALRAQAVDAWILGHIHAPALTDDANGPLVLYPGSPHGLDPGEQGAHGVWMLTIESGNRVRAAFRPIAPHQYLTLTIDATGSESADAVGALITKVVNEHLVATLRDGAPHGLVYVYYRINVIGRIPVGLDCDPVFRLIEKDLVFENGSIESITNRTQPAIDLDQLMHEQTPPGAVARLLRSLDSSEPGDPLRAQARERFATAAGQAHFSELDPATAETDQDLLRNAAWRLLETLVANHGAHR